MSAVKTTGSSSTICIVGWMFFSSGFAYAVWGVALPNIEQKFALGDARLGYLLFVLAAGAILMMLPAGKLIGKIGSRSVCMLGAILHAFTIVGISQCQSYLVLFVAVWLYGAATACFDTAMNAYTLEYEQRFNKPCLSAMHGMFSFGGMCGAILGGAFLGNIDGTSVFLLSGFNSLLACLMALFLVNIQPIDKPSYRQPINKRLKNTLKIGLIAFLSLMTEGAMYDWSSLFLRDELNARGGYISVGYFGFSAGMLLGRLFGDRFRKSFHNKSAIVISLSASIALIGVCMLLYTGSYFLAVVCFVVIGIGIANLIPVLFSMAGNVAENSGHGIAKVSLFAYFGFLVGPLLMGELASRYGLSHAFLLLVFALCLIVVINLQQEN